jgi:hypothetical protein
MSRCLGGGPKGSSISTPIEEGTTVSLIPSKAKELCAACDHVLAYPNLFGLEPNADGRLALRDIFESLLALEPWQWIALNDLEDTLYQFGRFGPSGEAGDLPARTASPDTKPIARPIPKEVFLPALDILEASDAERRGKSGRAYERLQAAALVAAHRSADFSNIRCMRVTTELASGKGAHFLALETGIVAFRNLPEVAGEVTQSEIKTLMPELLHKVRVQLTLYLNDSGQQSAARELFEAEPRLKVERELLRYLADEDPDVRKNVLAALSVPAHLVSVTPGRPFPPWQEVLEPLSLSPETMRQILIQARREDDTSVLEYIACLLTAQNYTGKLQPLLAEVRRMIENLMRRLPEPSVKQCREFLDELPESGK